MIKFSVPRMNLYNDVRKIYKTYFSFSLGDRAAAFHLAMQFETQSESAKAVQFFTQAGAFSSAIRLAKENGMVDKIANLALMAGGSELAEAAEYYKNLNGHADKTVMLYHKVRELIN
ncbi:unnamed protein product [Meloidogyne enterolobii]|uniref:Uncharacterized protein n=2 Tax=Meloidogyne enterolobii TaxID=390850 RepID=A0ACB0XWW1_MELEN